MAVNLHRFVSELSRRKVMRVVATYAIGTFGALQSADVIVSALGLPHYLMTGLVVLTFVGLPTTAVLAWVFDLTPEGVVRTAPLQVTPALASGDPAAVSELVAPAPAKGSRLGLALGVAAVVLGVSGVALFLKSRNKAPLASDLVAVMPFTVGGSEQYKYLRDGLPELLEAGMTGGGALRTVDEHALARAIKESGGDLDADAGREIARRFGAQFYLVGNVLEVKDRLRLHAQLYDANRMGDRSVGQANAEGDAAQLFTMVDEILRQLRPALLANSRAAANTPMVAMAEGATTSIAALKAFIEGEAALRDGDTTGALKALQRSVSEDENFALAQYRLAVVSSWTNEIPLGRVALAHALRERDKLSQRERDLIEAFAAYWRGHARDAEQRYRAILAKNPDDAESWYQLGEVLYHDGPFQGRPEAEARPYFEKAAALEPNQRLYSIHLNELARVAGDRGEMARLDELQLKSTPGEQALRWERAWAAGDVAQRLDAEKQLTDAQSLETATMLALNHSQDTDGLRTANAFLEKGLALPKLSAQDANGLHIYQSQLSIAQGKRKLANEQLKAVLPGEPQLLATLATRALAPFFPHDKAELTEAIARIPSAPTERGIHSPIEARVVHDYLTGRLAAQLGDFALAEKSAEALAVTDDSDDSALGADLALAVRAHTAAAKGNPAEALADLDQMSGGTALEFVGENYINGAGERWLHGDLLAQQGKYADALRWFESIETHGVGTWSAPIRFRRAEMLEHLGKKKEALEQYRLFADVWRDADPDLQPMVENARMRMSVLAREQVQ